MTFSWVQRRKGRSGPRGAHACPPAAMPMKRRRASPGIGTPRAAGLIDSIAHQTAEGSESPDGAAPGGHPRKLNLEDAVIFGVAAGSMALTCLGGVYYENAPGEKRRGMQKFLDAYRGELARGRGG